MFPTRPMYQSVSTAVKMNTEHFETENQPEPSGNSFPLPESELNVPDDRKTSVLSKPERTSSSDSKVNQIGEDLEHSQKKLDSRLSLRGYDSNQNTFIQESDDAFTTKLGVFLDPDYQIKEAFVGAQQAQDVIAKQATEIRQLKVELQLAHRGMRNEIGRKQLLEVEFEEFKKNAAVIQRQKEKLETEMVALKERVIKRKAEWRKAELEITAENVGLRRALGQLGTVNQRMLDRNESLRLSTKSATDLTEKHEAAQDNLQSTIVQLKRQLSSCHFQIDDLKKDVTFFRESSSKLELTASQLRKEIEDLRRAEMKSPEETLRISQVERIRDEKSLPNSSYETIDQQTAESKLALKISQLEKEAIHSRQAIELLQKENQEVWKSRVTFAQSAQKAEQMALKQIEALSDALTELHVAVKYSKGVAEAENDLQQNTDELKTDSKSTKTNKASVLKKWLIKRGLSKKQKPEESELTDLLRSTGISMMKGAKDLKEQAKIVAAKGKRLTERANQLSRN